MAPYAPPAVVAATELPSPARAARARRQARAIHRLREVLFELQCVPDPDAVAIDALMRRLARIRARVGRIDAS